MTQFRVIDADSGSSVPADSNNLVMRAVECFRQATGLDTKVSITLHKRIPSEAGLGGGSSDAAATLLGLNRWWKIHWPYEKLHPLAASLGSDVPFFLGSGNAIATGRGELIAEQPTSGSFSLVLAKPPMGASTKEVYGRCRLNPPIRSIDAFASAMSSGRARRIGERMWNRLQQPAEEVCPGIKELARAFDGFGLLGHQLSGSGSSYFGICRHQRHARRVAAVLRTRNVGRVFATSTFSGQRNRLLANHT